MTTRFIMFLAPRACSAASGAGQGLGVLPMFDALLDTSWLRRERGLAGGFLAGLVGYRPQPSALEVGAYAASLVAACRLLFGRLGFPLLPPVRPGHTPAEVG